MDNYQSSVGKSDEQIIWSLSADNQWSCSSPIKSFTCGFCNKGFSSAQALGGHMNVHRKDRAKLREVFHENQLSLDVSKSLNPADDHPLQHKNLFPVESMEETSNCIPKSPYSLSVQDDIITCSSKDLGNFPDRDELQTEVDLELRLGPDQTHEISSASSTKNTREFF